MKKLIKFTIWALSNIGLACMLAIAVLEGVQGAKYVSLFLVWLMLISSALACCSGEVLAKVRAKGASAPLWLMVLCDTCITLFLIWHGWWATGLAVFLTTIFQSHIYNPDQQEK
jgi:hypothetical protein